MLKRPSWVVLVALSTCSLASTATYGMSVARADTREGVSNHEGLEPRPRREKAPENSVFFEAGGSAFFYSFDYERMVVHRLGVRMGMGVFPLELTYASSSFTRGGKRTRLLVFVPVSASYIGIRAGSSALELGVGVTVFYGGEYTDNNGSTVSPTLEPFGVASAGYRYQRVDGRGFMFRVGGEAHIARRESPLPHWQTLGDFDVVPWPYLSMGASF